MRLNTEPTAVAGKNPASDDCEWARRCRIGDREAQRQLYEATVRRVYSALYRLTGNSDEAHDLAQDTYLRVFRRIGTFDGRSQLATWVYRVALNEGLQFLRKRKLERAALSRRAAAPTVRARENPRLDVPGALSRLDPDEQVLLILRYQEGLDYRAIAEVLGCQEGTVGSRLHRARARIRVLLEGMEEPREGGTGAEHLIEQGLVRRPDRGEVEPAVRGGRDAKAPLSGRDT